MDVFGVGLGSFGTGFACAFPQRQPVGVPMSQRSEEEARRQLGKVLPKRGLQLST